ncbi:uncharacterized protein MYCFIDRAFT_192586 [Pseudocercospora fijiensis CIRAD86]|uniref:SnoaL-like domain-containing protein n=1 Tax=Pseudocercospora fijiensis (strain CIRAD86) TaxID=383855 RepID=N1QB91_PSEFD|nr:uncharacterized protein MYCFIDRAFT_192586 [Pseudocercospora fijiensis CIRAD86]EME88407.1 hypothetical protein MYCFIDRAFT_192586 [Pseudocercospora fijiensis CIRAD86]
MPQIEMTPAEILQKFYDAETIYMAASPENRDFANGMGKTLSPNLKLYQSPDLPYGGVFEGHAGFQDWSQRMASYFDKLEVTDPQVFEQAGSDAVIVASTLKLRVRKTGKDLVNPLLQKISVDREKGVITEIRPFYWDVKGLNEALGL